MNTRLLLFATAASLVLCSCAAPPRRVPVGALTASDFEATIAGIRQTDPTSPALLNARLAYGEFLLSRGPGPCAQRLVLAQEQLGAIAASPEARVMFPQGWARAADLEYRLHLVRAECGSAADRRDDLLAAIAAARRAVGLYRNAFDYRAMVVMQFDVAVTLHRVGDDAAALTALQGALDMDREYAFEDDARQNYELLLTWRGQPAGPAQVAALMQDFPKREATLHFAWHASDAQIAVEQHRTFLEDDRVLHSHAAAAFEQRIAAQPGGGWAVSYVHRPDRYDPGVWPTDPGTQKHRWLLPPALLSAVDFKVSAKGELQGVTDAKALAARLTARVKKVVKAGAPSHHSSHEAEGETFDNATVPPGLLEAGTAQDYQLGTAMWIGARLEQGVWYELSAPLALPGMPQFVVQQRVEFAFTRRVPCTTGLPTPTCVEIVLHATPDEKSLHDVLMDITDPNDRFVDYDASIDARIVVDPATLLPYAQEEQVFWFASLGNGKGDALLESDHLVATTKYGPEGQARPRTLQSLIPRP